jgi:glycosyltransferase involved in cell wall biosynthesis
MRVLYFSRDYTTHDRRFLSALANTAHQVYYLRLERRGRQLEDRPLPPQIEQVQWAGGHAPARFQDGLRLLPGLKRVIGAIKPDLIQAGPLQTAAFLAALTGFRPLVSTSWGYDLLVDADRSPFWRWATRYTLRHSTVMIGDCKTIHRKAVALGMPEDSIVTFPWGVDLNHFTPSATFNLQPSTFTLLSTRGWEPIYGVEVLARAFVQVARDRPELRLLMLGNGSQAGLLRRIFLEGGALDRVDFLGQVGQAALPAFYRAADLYVSASHSDGSSISLLEALACGRPAVVSDIPGNREWIEPGVTGWLFPDGNAGALAETIGQAIEECQRLPEMGRAARRLAEQRANWEINFRELLRAYDLALRVGSKSLSS